VAIILGNTHYETYDPDRRTYHASHADNKARLAPFQSPYEDEQTISYQTISLTTISHDDTPYHIMHLSSFSPVD